MRRDPHILVPRYTDLEVRDMTPIKLGSMGGRWRVEKFKARGREGLIEVPGTRRVACDFPNLITDFGLNLRGFGFNTPPLSNSMRIHCGEGSATPTVADVALANWTAMKLVDLAGFPDTFFAQTTAPYYGSHRRKARFAAGFAGGAVNITELGIAPGDGNEDMFSRVLTLDGGGSPAAVPIDADEAFDAYYTLENYPDHVTGDGSGSVDISATVYNYTIRAARVTTPNDWARNIFSEHKGDFQYSSGNPGGTQVYGSDATLGAITSLPAATSTDFTESVEGTTCTTHAYVTDTFQQKITYAWGIGDGNVTGGIKAMLLMSPFGSYQLLFDNPIPKTGSNTLSFPLTTVWARHVY